MITANPDKDYDEGLEVIQRLLEVCGEAAVEIENAYGPDNIVAKRLRREIHNVIGKQPVKRT